MLFGSITAVPITSALFTSSCDGDAGSNCFAGYKQETLLKFDCRLGSRMKIVYEIL